MSLTFGGHPTRLRKVGNDVIINCKGINGLYSQFMSWKLKDKGYSNNYVYGVKTTETCYIRESIKKNHINIACLNGSNAEVNQIITECKLLLKSQ